MATWTLSSPTHSLLLPDWQRLRMTGEAGRIPVLLAGVVTESSQLLQMFSMVANRHVVDTFMGQIFRQYHFSAEGLATWQEAGVWVHVDALHPLHAAADKKLKQWFKTLRYDMAGEAAKMDFATLKLPKGSVHVRNGISYEGYTARFLKAHSLRTITDLVEKSVVLCKQAWNWEPVNLRVLTHTRGNAMGIAYAPGKGVHRISLASSLVNKYDEMSIFRVILHELCHHYREERFPRPAGYTTGDAHDKYFCDALSLVDPVVKEQPESCRIFTDSQWEGSEVVQQEKQTLQADRYDPERGAFTFRHLKSGQMRLDWKGEDFNKKAIVIGPGLSKITEGMTPAQQRELRVYAATHRDDIVLGHFGLRSITPGEYSFYDLMAALQKRFGIEGLVA